MISFEGSIQANVQRIQERISRAAATVGKPADSIHTVVVSKLQPPDVIRAAYAVGIRSFGENYPQEAEQKISSLMDLQDISWHMIGHIQSRKSPIIARHFQMIHSLDSVPHALKLEAALAAENKTLRALLEMNVGGEESKSGWEASSPAEWDKLLPDIAQLLQLTYLQVQGLMTMPPLANQPECSRPFFSKLRQMQEYLNRQFSAKPFTILSMGTSADFEVAIQEGATIVRIGQAILGQRPVKE